LYYLSEGRLLYTALITLVLLTMMLVTSRGERLRPVALSLGAPLLVGTWAAAILPDASRMPVVYVLHVLAPIFMGYTGAVVVRDILSAPRVSNDSLYGAFSCYLLIGLAFSHLYCLVETASPGSFQGSENLIRQLKLEHRQEILLAYFSLTTLTTLG